MAEAVEHFQHLTEDDLKSIATYLKTLPASLGGRPAALAANTPAMQRGALRYEVNCAACHGVRGEAWGNDVVSRLLAYGLDPRSHSGTW